MPKITYIENNGKSHSIEVSNGLSVMEGAVQNDIPGIDADCGGGMDANTLNVIYNLADFLNKIAFGLVIWAAATQSSGRKAR